MTERTEYWVWVDGGLIKTDSQESAIDTAESEIRNWMGDEDFEIRIVPTVIEDDPCA